MTDPIYCPVQTGWEMCESEVENEGDLCPAHDEDDRSDDDYDNYRESRLGY
jgi:hypothetical protein